MIEIPRMLMIGSGSRNTGKTTMACTIVERLCARFQPVAALKVTTVQEKGEMCHRGGRGCDACTTFEGAYVVSEEIDPPPGKDTTRLQASGADPVFWLRVMRADLLAGIADVLARIQADLPIICESNSLRLVVRPGLFLMTQVANDVMKPTARAVVDRADRVITFDGMQLDLDLSAVVFERGRWALKPSQHREIPWTVSRSYVSMRLDTWWSIDRLPSLLASQQPGLYDLGRLRGTVS